MIEIENLKKEIEKLGYYATDELIYNTFNSLCMFEEGKINAGQDIYAICLEGPPGAGKTEFAKTYTKIVDNMFNGNVEMVDYQCDATTGKTELFEDINISAVVQGDIDKINIPGKLIEAIKKVNEGKKVILFIDEYDKAREETDAFLLQFLQSGKINSTQHGDLKVIDEYKSNLQVILCKNDMREELSGPLSRRLRIIRLDYMKPEIFYKVAKRVLIDERVSKVNEGLLNLVGLMYQHTYDNSNKFGRLPSCSEMLIALEDADRLTKRANAPQYIIYNTIINNMFKSPDDIATFESIIKNSKGENAKKLNDLITSMKTNETKSQEVDVNSLIAQKVFTSEFKKLEVQSQEMQKLIDYYQSIFTTMDDAKKEQNETSQSILLNKGKLISNNNTPNVIRNFEDETSYVKRGIDIFSLSNEDWTNIGTFQMPKLSNRLLVNKIIENASELNIKTYENGFLIREDGEQKLIVVCSLDENNIPKYTFMSSTQIIPSTYISYIYSFINASKNVARLQAMAATAIADEVRTSNCNCNLDCLIYNDDKIDYLDEVQENIYNLNVSLNGNETDKLFNLSQKVSCANPNKALEASKEIMDNNKTKVYSQN